MHHLWGRRREASNSGHYLSQVLTMSRHIIIHLSFRELSSRSNNMILAAPPPGWLLEHISGTLVNIQACTASSCDDSGDDLCPEHRSGQNGVWKSIIQQAGMRYLGGIFIQWPSLKSEVKFMVRAIGHNWEKQQLYLVTLQCIPTSWTAS